MIKASLFDLGGTLIHYEDGERSVFDLTEEGANSLFYYLLERYKPLPPISEFMEKVRQEINRYARVAFRELRGGTVETPIRDAIIDMGIYISDEEWVEARRALLAPISASAIPREGVRETMQRLRERGIMLGIISNTFWNGDMHDEDLRRFGLLEFFPLRIYSCDFGLMKPRPEIFQHALNVIGVPPRETIYVGDRLNSDIEGARRVGMWGVLVEVPFREEKSENLQPDARIEELPGLIDLVEGKLK